MPAFDFLYFIERACALQSSGAALSPRQATYFSLSRQRNLRKRKATLVSASLRFAAGTFRCSAQPGSRSNSLRSDNRGPSSVWASAPQRIHKGFGEGLGIGFGLGQIRKRYCFHSCLRKYYLGWGLKTLQSLTSSLVFEVRHRFSNVP